MNVNVSVIVATYGAREWQLLARKRAIPSAYAAMPMEVVVRHEPHGTLASARNGAAAEAQGTWLCFLDADDELDPLYFACMRDALATHRYDPVLLAPAVEYIHGDRTVGPAIPNKGMWPDVNECVIGTLVQKKLFLEAGGFEEWAMYEDYALWLACERLGARIFHVPDAIYRAHVRLDSRNTPPSATVRLTTYNEIRRQDRWAREGR